MKSLKLNIFEATEPQLAPAKGRVLIAEPFMEEPFFKRSIVYLAEYNHEGAVGFLLNKSSELYPDEMIEDLFNFRGRLFIGGPVESDSLHYIHTLGAMVTGSIKISDNLYWGGDFEKIKSLINIGMANENNVKFFAGYSGWATGQLEHEIMEKSWVVADVADDLVMNNNVDNYWQKMLEELGGDVYRSWANFPHNPAFN
ncbi:putative transcriptional regulator [Breznakibacter xylanolyticus]|uniref:UPF0301 protein LX69_00120 n=1 Tax=Breznakibacter xylanolyticus TaxID=990 RepID=A0A2W7NJS7_9BACT|nr:YqgE/AlgH family protein [Breznakibacter xylanolyticus]MBN2742337.1 YqgE/AlgH family protein [Marinilabiliaceae bacterium]PZX20695.1 putative transcriptional regulator [Breznakibacter xylanolyticus]